MEELKSYEEFAEEFYEPAPKLSKKQQAMEERIRKVLNQRAGELGNYNLARIKRNLGLFDLQLEEIKIIEELSLNGELEGKPTNEVYQKYCQACKNGGISPMNQIAFSRFVIKYFDYIIIDKRVEGIKSRVFIRGYDKEKSTSKEHHEEWWK